MSDRDVVVELRLHGVVDSTPEYLLEHSSPQRLSGDEVAGFYGRPDRDDLEAYSWSGVATRTGSRAAWLLLAPFAFANVAGWLLPFEQERDPSSTTRVQKAVVRLAASLITVFVVLGVWLLAADLVGYQCGGQPSCAHGLLGIEAVGASNPARRIAIGMVAPVAAVALLAFAGARSRTRYEAAVPHDQEDEGEEADPALILGLRDAQFWHSPGFVQRLANLHLAAGLLAIAIVTSLALWRLERASPGTRAWELVDLVLVVTASSWALVAALAVGIQSLARRHARAVRNLAAALVACVAVGGAFRTGPAVPSVADGSPLFDDAHVTAASATLVLLLLGLALLAFAGRPAGGWEAPEDVAGGFGRLGPLVLMSLAGASVALLVAPIVVWVARWLNGRSSAAGRITYSAAFDWVVVLAVVAGGMLVVAWIMRTALLAFGRNGWRAARWAPMFDEIYDGRPDIGGYCLSDEALPCHPAQRPGMVRLVVRRWRRRAAGSSSGVMTRFVVLMVLGIAALITARAGDGLPPVPSELSPLLGVIFFGSALYIAIRIVIRRLRGLQPNPEVAGRVAELATWWDAVSFWPRWYHPLGPPGLGLRAVPELVTRLRRLTEPRYDEPVSVLISSHGTGSVMAAAAVMRMRNPGLSRLALMTLGSPLRRVYGRYFASYFGSAQLRRVEVALRHGGRPGWVNLYRLTDQLGGAVFGERPVDHFRSRFGRAVGAGSRTEHGEPVDPVDVLVPDPITDHHEPGDPCPVPRGHRGYFSDPPTCSWPPYTDVLAAMREDLAGRATAPPTPSSA